VSRLFITWQKPKQEGPAIICRLPIDSTDCERGVMVMVHNADVTLQPDIGDEVRLLDPTGFYPAIPLDSGIVSKVSAGRIEVKGTAYCGRA